MRVVAGSAALSFWLLVTIAFAGDVVVGPFSMTLPAAFKGPVRATPDAKSETIVYSSPRQQGQASNVIQFTRYAIGVAPPIANEDAYVEGATQYLKQMLQGVERRRTAYVQSSPERFRLSGHLGARATWSGALNGTPTNGVMYSAIIGADVWFIHVFGPGDRPDTELQTVISAVERAEH